MRIIPRHKGKSPVPAARNVPIGILRERRVEITPKRKITIPPVASSLFKALLPRINFRFQIINS
jgi:hypothetical protein